MIGAHARTDVDGMGVGAAKPNASFGARDEEGAGGLETVQAQEVYVGAIHDVEGARLGRDDVEDLDIRQFSIRNLNKRGVIRPSVKVTCSFSR